MINRATAALPAAWRPANASRSLDAIYGLAGIAALALWVGTVLMAQPGDDAVAGAEGRRADGAPRSTGDGPRFVISGYGGYPYTYPSDVRIRRDDAHDFTAKDVPWEGQPFKNPVYYGVRVARWGGASPLGGMLDFTHSKTIAKLAEEAAFEGKIEGQPAPAKAVLRDVFRRLEASHGHNMLTLNGLVRVPGAGLGVVPYLGGGAGVSLPHSEVQLQRDNARTYEYQFAGPVAQGLAGLEFRLPRFTLFVEYKFTWAPYTMPLTRQDGSLLFLDLFGQFKRWWSGETPPGGYASVQLTSHQVIAGVGFRVGALPAAR